MAESRPMYGQDPSRWTFDYHAADNRYDVTNHRRLGRSGIRMAPVSIGAWQNMSDLESMERVRAIYRHAFDLGITHFDFANNYGRPPGSAEFLMGRMLATDFRAYRDELFIATKAGYDMWPGPYGTGGSRKYLLASLDQSLSRLGLDYVDLFYSHRYDPETDLAETMGALTQAVRQGKALYTGISSYPPTQAAEALGILRDNGTPAIAYQGSYSIINRWPEERLFDVLRDFGVAFLPFSPLAQGLLTRKYTSGPDRADSVDRASERGSSFPRAALDPDVLRDVAALGKMAQDWNRSLVDVAIQWCLHPEVSASVVAGVRSCEQLSELVAAGASSPLDDDLMKAIRAVVSDHAFDPWRVNGA